VRVHLIAIRTVDTITKLTFYIQQHRK